MSVDEDDEGNLEKTSLINYTGDPTQIRGLFSYLERNENRLAVWVILEIFLNSFAKSPRLIVLNID